MFGINKKAVLAFSSYLLFIVACNNNTQNKQEENLITKQSSAHFNIPGTHVHIIPPGGFKPSTGSMKGFIKDEATTFLSVTEFKGHSFESEIEKNSAEKMRQQGFSIFLEQEKKVGPYKGRLMRIGDGEISTVWQLVFGDESFAVMVMGIYPSHDELTGKQIAEALETVVYDKEMIVDEMAWMKFIIKPNESRYKYLKMEARMAFYSLDGEADIKNENISFLIVSQLPIENSTPQSIAETSFDALLRNGFSNTTIKSKGFLTINGNKAYEMEVEGTLKGKREISYIVVVANDETAILVQGTAKSNVTETMEGFKNFADAIVIK